MQHSPLQGPSQRPPVNNRDIDNDGERSSRVPDAAVDDDTDGGNHGDRPHITSSRNAVARVDGKDRNKGRKLGKEISDWTVKELQDELHLRNLPIKGKKRELAERLRIALEEIDDDTEVSEAEERDHEQITQQDEELVLSVVNNQRQQRGSTERIPSQGGLANQRPDRQDNRQLVNINVDQIDDVDDEGIGDQRRNYVPQARRYEEAQRLNTEVRPRVVHQQNIPPMQDRTQAVNPASTFTIKDVEGSIPFFTGDDKTPIQRWIADFEDTSTLLGWNDLQMVIYGKKMLRGSAKQYMALEQGITSWAEFKRRMIREFEVEVNSAVIHAQLSQRKRQVTETPRQYVYAMQTIANQGYIKNDAVIQYIIDGIPDAEANKQILYNARTITELKKSLEIYDRMQERSGKKKPATKSDVSKNKKEDKDSKQSTTKKLRCFACGSAEHEVKQCPHKEKGPKCFKCNQFGHIASKCDNKSDKKEDKVNCVTSNDDMILVQINESQVPALLDTGSYKTLLREDEYRKIGNPMLRPTERVFKGFGNAQSREIGVFDAELRIDGETYRNAVYVVPTEATDSRMILGKDLQRQIDINIRGGRMTIRKIPMAGGDTSTLQSAPDTEEQGLENEEIN